MLSTVLEVRAGFEAGKAYPRGKDQGILEFATQLTLHDSLHTWEEICGF
jgi:hypothetical protein